LGSAADLSLGDLAADIVFLAVGVKRDLRPVEHWQQFRLAVEQAAQQPIEHREPGSPAEGAIKAGAKFDPALCRRLLAVGFEVGLEPPDQLAHLLLGGVLVVGEGVEPVH